MCLGFNAYIVWLVSRQSCLSPLPVFCSRNTFTISSISQDFAGAIPASKMPFWQKQNLLRPSSKVTSEPALCSAACPSSLLLVRVLLQH